MVMSARWVVVLALVTGCQLSMRQQSGGAISKPGVSGGTMRSIYFEDTGGPLSQIVSRLSLLVFGTLGAVGAAGSGVSSNTTSSGIYDSSGNRVGTQETTTYTPTGGTNAEAGQRAQGLVDAAGSADLDVSGVTAGLEIASTKLGGDTSGWFLDAGFKTVKTYGAWGIRSVVKAAAGKVTQHDRMLRTFDNSFVSESMGDASYRFGGFRLGLGIQYRRTFELFTQLDLNTVGWLNAIRNDETGRDESPSPWTAGGRVMIKGFYAQAAIMASRLDGDHTSTVLEVGFELTRRPRR